MTSACGLYIGRRNRAGYGQVGRALAHRAAWEAVHGLVPPGMELHHVCGTKACVNVDHLVPVTRKQHVALHMPTHCRHGHPFDAGNTYLRPDRPERQCRACRRAAMARYRKAKP